ncbi:MAG TPA: UDP-2,3-diacylglucosamine diphosphatase [Gammaproteobacteria bacterium]
MTTLFIADLHLSKEQPELLRLFLAFLQGPAAQADALYILGDLFEAWLGDDLVLPEYQPVLDALCQLTASGVPVFVMHGNRDFLLGQRFAAATGCTLIDDPTVIQLYGTPTLLMHGDLLCSDDVPYQQLRTQLRDPKWIAQFLALPARERIAFAQKLRQQSKEETRYKVESMMDANNTTVSDYLMQFGVTALIHGHTHRPAVHEHGDGTTRYVLGDWHADHAMVLVCDETKCRLVHYSAQ